MERVNLMVRLEGEVAELQEELRQAKQTIEELEGLLKKG